MRELYEGYIGLSVDHGPNSKYSAAEAPAGYSYRKGQLPTGYPGYGRGYDRGVTQPGIAIINADEEGQSIAKAITLKKVDELIEQSVADEMNYATIQLAKLKKFIEHQKVLDKRN